MELKVFDFSDPVDFLNASLGAIQSRNPQFSMRAWAKQLGLSHVAMLSMVLGRKRRLLPSLSSRISRQFASTGMFTETEARYFDVLVLFTNSATVEEKHFYEGILASLRPDRRFSNLDLDKLRTIADWYHVAILEMTSLKDFRSDPRWISLRLGDNVSQSQVEEAIDRLLRLGLLEQTADGQLRKTSCRLSTPTDIPDRSLKKFHSDMLAKASRALCEQPVERRDITGFTLTISTKKIPEAKKMIKDFRRRLADFLETPNGDAVYQINVQLFDILGDQYVQ